MSGGSNHIAARLRQAVRRNRKRAEECERNARSAAHPLQRESFLRAAAVWTKTAEDAAKELERRRLDEVSSERKEG
jgi:hypothetical protein